MYIISDDDLEEFLKAVITANDRGISPLRNATNEMNWSFGQALFFSSTVVTTIGKLYFFIYRLWPCDTIKSNWQNILHDLCRHWHTIDFSTVECNGGEIINTSQLVVGFVEFKTGPFISTL